MQNQQSNPYDMQTHLNTALDTQQYRFALSADTPEDFIRWQQDFRPALLDVLKITNRIPSTVPSVNLVTSKDRGSYVEECHELVIDDLIAPLYVLMPKTPPPYKVILALHGHGIGVRQILGHYADADITQQMLATGENFAQQFAEAGYLVCAVEQRGFGRRVADRVGDNANSCQQLAYQYLMTGKTLLGERVRDAIASLNYLVSRDDIDKDSIGCTGHSGGGMTGLFLAAIDSRVDVSVISGYFCDYRESILGMRHCECNYVPDLLSLGNVAEIAALIAPRPLRFVNGEADHIFPIEGVYPPYKQVENAYRLLDAESKLSLVTHPSGHRYDYGLSRAWFASHLVS